MSDDRIRVFWDPACLDHYAPDGVFERPPSPLLAHQIPTAEGPVRIDNIRSLLERAPLADMLDWRRPEPASDAEILRFHDTTYLDLLKDADRVGRWLTGTTYLAMGGLQGARIAAGAAIEAAVMS